MIRVSRRYTFSAAHVLAREDWDQARNVEIYGKCANPSGHGHNYEVWVTLRGELDPKTGRLVPLDVLDAIVQERVVARLDHCFLNRDVDAFKDIVPTAENIARHIWDVLKGEFAPVTLDRIRLVETRNNSVEYSEE
ncbi:MAG: 6-carboxytetrahydropterin synthase [bacterium]|nr:6-carboxytetrahydropterin synthase [bacterium]